MPSEPAPTKVITELHHSIRQEKAQPRRNRKETT